MTKSGNKNGLNNLSGQGCYLNEGRLCFYGYKVKLTALFNLILYLTAAEPTCDRTERRLHSKLMKYFGPLDLLRLRVSS